MRLQALNSGVGKLVAIRFSSEGYYVVMTCSNLEKSQDAHQEIIVKTGRISVDLLHLDIASFDPIKDFAKEF